MTNPISCVNQLNKELSSINKNSDPKEILLFDYHQLLLEAVVVDARGKEIGSRLTDLLSRAKREASQNQQAGEPFNKAVIRNALRLLGYQGCQTTPGGLPTGPAYKRPFPDTLPPQNFGHEKVNYPMSDYDHRSYLPVGGLGAPLCEIDYATCYLQAGQMVQDEPIRKSTLEINGQTYDLAKTPGKYFALFPFSEISYDLPISFSVQQYSPVIPGSNEASSLPVEYVELHLENTTSQPMTVTYTLTQENILGWYPKKAVEDSNDPHGRLLWNKQNKDNSANRFNDETNTGVVFYKNTPEQTMKNNDPLKVGVGLAGQVAIISKNIPGKVAVEVIPYDVKSNSAGLKVTLTLAPGEKISQPLAVAYDLPFYRFQHDPTNPESPGTHLPKYYTRSYGASGKMAAAIAGEALAKQPEWKTKLTDFQKTITEDSTLPDFFKQALLNELYVLPETGIWEADGGRFAYLESIDYKMYNTSDVNAYTWALLTLYPELEKKDLLEFAKLIPLTDGRRRWFGTDRWAKIAPEKWQALYWAPIKDEGTVCHDLGGLLGQGVWPFTNSCNEFDWSNTNMWIDLAPKFALRSWRYLDASKSSGGKIDREFLTKVYPAVTQALDTLEQRWADKETHVPVSKGIPDWTYDTIAGVGYTPNVVTQWLGALEAAVEMAKLVGDKSAEAKYSRWLADGKPALDKLWNPAGYYNAFVSVDGKTVNENIHSDMLFGDFYTRMTNLSPVVPNGKASQALNTMFQINGQQWSTVGNHGPLGLVNLRGPHGEQNRSEQGDEGWTGTMLLNAAHQIKVGRETNNPKLISNGWQIVHGFFNVVYSQSPDSQHWFGRTPEGYTNPDDLIYDGKDGKKYREGKILADGTTAPATGRALKYMRALAIWAVYAALKK